MRNVNRFRFLGLATIVSSVVVVLCLRGLLAYAISLPAGSYRAEQQRHGYVPRVPHASPLGDGLGAEAAHPAGDTQQQELDKFTYLPLALKNYCGPWCPDYRRFGFNWVGTPIAQYDIPRLRAGRYMRYPGFLADPPPLDLEFLQLIRLNEDRNPPSETEIVEYATTHPGTLWLIGNEPDCIWQDNVTPRQYAEMYHELHGIIKGADPSARVAVGGIVQATPLRLQYLDLILEEYQGLYEEMIPADAWHVHNFILEETPSGGAGYPPGVIDPEDDARALDPQDHDNMTIFADQIFAFRQWMKDRGEGNKPLIVSEYGILFPATYGFDEARVEAFMIATFDYFLSATGASVGYPSDGSRLVQAWYWFSLDWKNVWGYETYTHLFDPDTGQITPLGIAYGDYTSSLP